jgi:outer membrane immunogenic protein
LESEVRVKIKFLVSAMVTTVFAGSCALAADLYEPAPPVAPEAKHHSQVDFDWTGAYLGVQGGFDLNLAKTTSTSPLTFRSAPHGWSAGLYGGYNWQRHNIVFGIDGNISYVDGNGKVLPAPGYRSEVNWKGNLRGRLGFTIHNRFLLYGAAGVAFSNLKLTNTGPACGGTCGNPSTYGWTVGAGAEWAVHRNWIARFDYAYTDFDTFKYSTPVSFSATSKSHAFTGGLALKF